VELTILQASLAVHHRRGTTSLLQGTKPGNPDIGMRVDSAPQVSNRRPLVFQECIVSKITYIVSCLAIALIVFLLKEFSQ
jgi:hypothetical protein